MTEPSHFVDDFFVDAHELPSALTQRHRVDVLMVTHDGARWLPRSLAALRGSTVRPDAVHVLDTGSLDATAAVIADAGSTITTVLKAPRDQPYGVSLAQLVAALPALPEDASHPDAVDHAWLWIIHDDSAPAADALGALLRAAEAHPDAAIFGCKSVGWNDSSRLQEVGLTLTGSGHRSGRVERGERDQGQYQATEEVLAVGSAGMLVRRDVWATLDGMRGIFAFYRDDIDFCWRAWEHGYRVRVVPQAEIAHREAATMGVRAQDVVRGSSHRVGREVSLTTAYIHTPALLRPLTLVRLTLASLARAFVYFVGKDPRDSGDELAALFAFLRSPLPIMREIESRGVVPIRAPRSLRPSAIEQLWHGVDLLATLAIEKVDDLLALWAGSDVFDVVDVVDDVEDVAEAADPRLDEPVVESRSRRQDFLSHVWRRPGMLLFLALFVIGVVGTRNIWGSGTLQGGGLMPVVGSTRDLFGYYFSDWHRVGLGSPAPAAPWMPLLGVWALLFGGNVPVAVTALLVLAIPLAGLSAHLAARPVIPQAEPRAFFAATYALLPAVLVGIANGRLGVIVLAIAMPVVLRLAWRCDESWQRAGVMMLAVAFTAAWVPVVWLFFVLFAIAAAIVWRRDGARRRRLLAIAIGAWALVFPASVEWLRYPASLLRGTGAEVPGVGGSSFPDLLMVQPGGAASPWLYACVGLPLAGAAALLQRRRARRVVVAWTAVAIMFTTYVVVALIAAWTHLGDPSTGAPLQRWGGPFTLVLGLLWLIIIAAVTDGLAESLSRSNFGWRHLVTVLLAAGVVLAPVLSAGSWLWRNGESTVTRTDTTHFPAFVMAKTSEPMAMRVLVLHRDDAGAVRFSIYDGGDARIGDADVARTIGNADVTAILGSMLSGRDRTEAQRLADFGIMYVVCNDGDTGITQALDGAVGLRRVSGGTKGATSTWEVQAPNQRLAMLWFDSGKTVVEPIDYTVGQALAARVHVDAVSTGRVLTLAEPGGAWSATLDGKELQRASDYTTSWRQAWRVPAGAHGTLVVQYRHGQRLGAITFQLIALLAALGLSLPTYRPFRDLDPEVVPV